MSTWEARMAAKSAARRAKPEGDAPDWVLRERDDYCRECAEVFMDGVWGWRVRLTCGNCKFDHRHHDDEVWLA